MNIKDDVSLMTGFTRYSDFPYTELINADDFVFGTYGAYSDDIIDKLTDVIENVGIIVRKGIRELEEDFWKYRAKAEAPTTGEYGVANIKDELMDDYMGRIKYTSGDYELGTRGMELLNGELQWGDPWVKDPEFLDFILGMLAGI